MKSVGKQLQEARLAKNWTPELASRETKIKVDRLRDLEADDYSHFTSPAYARGFVRTYARFLGLDEYKILRQLDNKLPEDDTSNLITDSSVAYLPETAMPSRVAHRDNTGLYIVMALGCCVLLISGFVIFQAYRVGELPGYFAHDSNTAAEAPAITSSEAHVTESDAPPRATAVDPNDADHAPKAQAVSPADLAAETNATPSSNPATAPSTTNGPLKALPVDPSDLTNPPSSAQTSSPGATPPPGQTAADVPNPPRALPVDPSELTGTAATPDVTEASTNAVSLNPPVAKPVSDPSLGSMAKSARQSNSGPVVMPPAPVPSTPNSVPADESSSLTGIPVAPIATVADAPQVTNPANKILVLTASQDSFVRVTSLDLPDTEKPLYAATLRSGQSVAFDGRKFAINVGVPSAIDIKLDGHDEGPHSDGNQPETFTVESHRP
jgi:cytoskeletal protein RodZ